MDLDGKVVLVTGGSRGIGAAIVRAAAAAGAHVVLHYGREAARAQALAAEIGSERCLVVGADFLVDREILDLWATAEAWRGRVDVLVNNAGIYEPADVTDDFDHWRDGWQRTLQINLIAAAHLSRQAAAHFRRSGGGILIHVASRAAFRGDDVDYMHYAASKAGMVAMSRTIARGYGEDGILSYVLAPGFVRTEMAEEYVARHGDAHIIGDIPLGDMAPPEEVANLAVFLAAGMARHATGTTIDINGASYVR